MPLLLVSNMAFESSNLISSLVVRFEKSLNKLKTRQNAIHLADDISQPLSTSNIPNIPWLYAGRRNKDKAHYLCDDYWHDDWHGKKR